jgi:hypothetical protein
MRLNEVTKLTEQELHDVIDATNDTEFTTEDLVKIVVTEQEGNWSEPMTAEDLLAEMDSWTK